MTRVKIDRIGTRGDGMGNDDGKTVIVGKTLPGETIEIVDGKLKKIVTVSPDRIAPFCAHYDACGGCKFQHWAHAPYADWKRALVADALKSQGLDVTVDPLVDAHGTGRRRVSLHVRQVGTVWRAGYMEAKSHDLVAIDTCPVMAPQLAGAPEIAAAFGPLMGPCDVALTVADNGLDVSIKAEREAVAKRIPAFNELMARYGIARISVNGDVSAQSRVPTLKVGAASVQLPVQSFLQATAKGEESLVEQMRAPLKKSKIILDLFCGVGPFAFRLAENAKVHAIDLDKPAIASMLQAMRFTTGLKPLTAESRDLFDNPMVPAELNEYDAVVFDPPRAGAEAQARNLAKSKVKRVIAVACDVTSFARDAAILTRGGYKLEKVTPVDQFKYTAHVEIVGVFKRP
jgi:23S rRNA (uracil1939-C5)-methyltransferase